MNAIALVLFVSTLAAHPAQSWSQAQQEIIDQIRRCNDAWVASLAEKRFEVYDAVCPATEGAVFWYTDGETPVPYKGPNGLWLRSSAENRSIAWQDLQPVVVQVDDDVALIYYSVTWTPQPATGLAVPRQSRRLTVFQRRNGRWVMAGGTIASVRD